MITFALEKLSNILQETKPLNKEQWDETENYRSHLPFNPDYESLIKFNDVDFYLLFTARDSGVLVGFLSLYVTNSMHTQTKLAQEDTLFLTKTARGGKTACNLVRFAEAHLKEIGVQEIYITVKKNAKSRSLMEYLEYVHVADGMHKIL